MYVYRTPGLVGTTCLWLAVERWWCLEEWNTVRRQS